MADRKESKVPARESGALQPEARANVRTIAPAVDIYEKEDGLYLLADMPGVPLERIRVDTEKDVLSITGSFEAGTVLTGDPVYTELAPCEYHRAFALGEDLDTARITATLRDGVLELFLPKAARAKVKKIKVEAA